MRKVSSCLVVSCSLLLPLLAPGCGGDDVVLVADAGTDAVADASDAGIDAADATVLDAATDSPADAPADAPTDGSTTIACDAGTTVTLTKVDPLFGATASPTPITVTGSGFVSTPTLFVRNTSTQAVTNLPQAAFVSSTSVSGVVPGGLAVGGYDVGVVDPNGCGAYLPGVFHVLANPPPEVVSVSPATGTTQNDTPVTITGCHFPASPGLSTVDSSNASVAQTAGGATCTGPTNVCADASPLCTMTGTIKTKTLAPGAFLVRVLNTADSSYGDYASFVVTDPSGKLTGGWVAANPLVTGRRALASVAGRINLANRFLYALGGENAAGNALDSVEVAPLDKFGATGKWFVQKNKLGTARSGAAAVRQGSYIYMIGGTSSQNGTGGASPTGSSLTSVERAIILDPAGAPKATGTAGSGGTLAAGTYYYKVSAIMGAGDADNPNGETLGSDEVIVTVAASGKVSLSWPAVAGAVSYRVYRSPAVNGASQSEVLLKSGITLLTYDDTGADAPGSETFMAAGSTGVWVGVSSQLQKGRFNTSATVAPDPSGALHVYVVGGWGSCAGGANTEMTCYEVASLNAKGDALGAFTLDTTNVLTKGRQRHGLAAMTAANGPSDFAQKAGANTAFLLAGGGKGLSSSGQTVEVSLIGAGGTLKPWSAITGFANERDGSQMMIANGYSYQFVGGTVGSYKATSDLSTTPVITTPDGGGSPTFAFGNWSNAGSNLGTNVGRNGVTLESAYFYLVGGTSNDTDALSTVYQIVF